jgi:hypothetical protein
MFSNRWHKIKSKSDFGPGGRHQVLCTGAFLYATYSFLLISNKIWMGGGGWGEQCGNVTLPHWQEVGDFINPVFAKKKKNMRFQLLETNVLYVLCFFCKNCFYKFVRSNGGNSRKEWKRCECSGWPSKTGGWRSPPHPPPPTHPTSYS